MNRDEVLIALADKLEERYGVRPGIFHREGYVLIEDASRPDGPILPEDVSSIVRQVAQQFNLRFTELAYTIRYGNIRVGFADQ